MSSVQLYPEVKDGSSLGALFAQVPYLLVGVEGAGLAAGDGDINVPLQISRPIEADTAFGAGSSLANLCKFVLGRGVPTLKGVASIMPTTAGTPTLAQRQAAWAMLEDDRSIRLRLTDSLTQSELAALSVSCENAEKINHKQVAMFGMASGIPKTTLITAAAAINSKRGVLVGPGIYDENGNLLSGGYAAAAAAAEVSKNPDIADDLDTMLLPGFTGIEKDANGMPVFRIKANAGSPINEYEDLLQAGVSPLRQGKNGGVEISHLRMTYKTDGTFDALMTRLIVDQVFIDVRNYCEDNNFLRRGNTAETRGDMAAGVQALLFERRNWIAQIVQPDGELGYNVAVTSSPDERQVIVSYSGRVVRGIQTILVDSKLQITV